MNEILIAVLLGILTAVILAAYHFWEKRTEQAFRKELEDHYQKEKTDEYDHAL